MDITKERSATADQQTLSNKLLRRIRRNEEQLFLVLTLVIGVVVGLTIVAFVVLTERVGLRLYPAEHSRGGGYASNGVGPDWIHSLSLFPTRSAQRPGALLQ